jgi:hypothetical protein
MEKINTLSPERLEEVSNIIKGLITMVDSNELKEVESAQPENLNQYELKDKNGNGITYIRDVTGNLAHPIEVRDSKGKLIAQSWDGKEWSVDKYIENGVDFAL